jgi:cytochrome c oxidase subunit 2
VTNITLVASHCPPDWESDGVGRSVNGVPSVLDPRGPRAAPDSDFGGVLFGLAAVIFAVVVLIMLVAVARHRGRGADLVQPGALPGSDARGHAFIIGGGLILPIVTLIILVGLTLRTMLVLSAPVNAASFTIRVIGHQFWWEVRYPDQQIVTANEIHIPAGHSVSLELSSVDVIHSFWVPQIMPKVDMIPGHPNTSWVQADQPGEYRGQCAEFCGVQHAHMAFLVIADPPDQFANWLADQQRPAVQVQDPNLLRGAQVFSGSGCITCHAIRVGAQATGGGIGPDLTHVASRGTLAAGLLANNRGNLGGWISNPQALKPGNVMPALNLNADDLRALIDYLETLT